VTRASLPHGTSQIAMPSDYTRRTSSVEFEFSRDGRAVILSARSEGKNFVMTLPVDGVSVFALAATSFSDSDSARGSYRFTISRATLEVSK
jgi:hypothetical protein